MQFGININGTLDKSTAQTFNIPVTGKTVTRGWRGAIQDNLLIQDWKDSNKTVELEVTESLTHPIITKKTGSKAGLFYITLMSLIINFANSLLVARSSSNFSSRLIGIKIFLRFQPSGSTVTTGLYLSQD
jgi:hypothetical protein